MSGSEGNQLGRILKEARNSKGVTLSDAQQATKIRFAFLQALENEDYAILPPPFYIRGFIKNYSSYLGLDSRRTIGLFDEMLAGQPTTNLLNHTPAQPAADSGEPTNMRVLSQAEVTNEHINLAMLKPHRGANSQADEPIPYIRRKSSAPRPVQKYVLKPAMLTKTDTDGPLYMPNLVPLVLVAIVICAAGLLFYRAISVPSRDTAEARAATATANSGLQVGQYSIGNVINKSAPIITTTQEILTPPPYYTPDPVIVALIDPNGTPGFVFPTATPAPPTPLPTFTLVPSTFTPIPTDTPVPPTTTPIPTDTPVPPTATAIPTDTPVPPTVTATPTNTPVPTATFVPTNTPVPATATFEPTNTPLPTFTPVPIFVPVSTNTPKPTVTAIPTDTPVPPTPTFEPTSTPLPTPTSTPFPTATFEPTNTPLPTNTPVPPTATFQPTNTPWPTVALDPPTPTPTPAIDSSFFSGIVLNTPTPTVAAARTTLTLQITIDANSEIGSWLTVRVDDVLQLDRLGAPGDVLTFEGAKIVVWSGNPVAVSVKVDGFDRQFTDTTTQPIMHTWYADGTELIERQ